LFFQATQALQRIGNQVSFLRDQRKGFWSRIGIIFFWVLIVCVLGPNFQKLLNLPEPQKNLFIALGAALGFCIGAYAAFGSSRLAILLAFPVVIFGMLPF
jgi:hypothetical protein